jgi:hypothetical protein
MKSHCKMMVILGIVEWNKLDGARGRGKRVDWEGRSL